MLNKDYQDMLQILLENKVRFLVIGAYALAVYGRPRGTGDIDIWVDNSSENAQKVYDSLKKFGTPMFDVTVDTFTEENIIFQIGVAPRRIDILTHIDGVSFQEAYTSKTVIVTEGLRVPFLSKEDLIKNKLSTGREKDRLDVNGLLQDR